jgi:hypothetical protein
VTEERAVDTHDLSLVDLNLPSRFLRFLLQTNGMNRRDSSQLPPSHNSVRGTISDAYNQVTAMLSMNTELSSPPDVRNVSDDRIHPQISHRRRDTFESTDDGDVVIVKPHHRSPLKQRDDWQSRSPQQEDGKDASSEQRNPASPPESQIDVMGANHTRNLSAHFFDATTIGRAGSLDSADMYKEEEYPEQNRKHRRLMSSGSLPGIAHRRLNSIGTSAHIDRRQYHQREHSAGLDILSAAVVDASKDELAQAAGEQRVLHRSEWEEAPPSHMQHMPYDPRSYLPPPSPHHLPISHSMQPPHSRRYSAPSPPGPYMHTPGRSHHYSHHVPYSGYPHSVYYPPGYPPRHGYVGHEYPSQHSTYPHKAAGTMYPPETRSVSNDAGSLSTIASPKADRPWIDASRESGGTHQGSQTFVTAMAVGGGRTIHTTGPSKRQSMPIISTDSALDVPKRVSHHRKMSSFSNIGLGTVFGSSVLSPEGESETHPLMCAPALRGAAHHRSTSSSVSFMNALDMAGMSGTADETFLRNLHESSDADFRAATPSGATSSPLTSSTEVPTCNLAAGGSNKRIRRKCTVSGCANRVVQGGLCISHGAKRKICGHPGCNKNVKKAGLCSTHGPARKRCEQPGCQKVAVQGGRCIAHGAKKRLCEVENCNKQAILGGMCKKHHDGRKDGSGDDEISDESEETVSRKTHKATHTRGLSIFHDISADAVQSLLNAETVIVPTVPVANPPLPRPAGGMW